MLATTHLAGLMQRPAASGANLILVGDDKQLSSIERGGMFGALKAVHGAAELHTVWFGQDPSWFPATTPKKALLLIRSC